MVHSFCTRKLEDVTILLKYYYHFDLICCVLHFSFSLMAISGNLLVIYALKRVHSIPSTLKTLFLSLAFSDLGVGFYVQPMLGVVIALTLNTAAKGSYNFDFLCPSALTVNVYFAYFLSGASFFTIAAIALDRFVAVTFHLRYEELVTEKRVGIAITISWLTSGLVGFAFIGISTHDYLVNIVVQTLGLLVITVTYLRIFKIVRYHRHKIQSELHIQNGRAIATFRAKKSVINCFYVYIIVMACYVPNIIASILLIVDKSKPSFVIVYYVSTLVICINSSLNPLVYCWRYPEIRNIVINTVKKVFCINNRMA